MSLFHDVGWTVLEWKDPVGTCLAIIIIICYNSKGRVVHRGHLRASLETHPFTRAQTDQMQMDWTVDIVR